MGESKNEQNRSQTASMQIASVHVRKRVIIFGSRATVHIVLLPADLE